MTRQKLHLPMVIIGVALGMTLSGCGGTSSLRIVNGPVDSLTAFQRYPITVSETLTRMTINTSPTTFAVTQADHARVRAFGTEYLDNGHGSINIMTPTGTANAAAAIGVAAEISNSLNKSGIAFKDIRVVPYQTENGADIPPVIVSYTRFSAQVGPCGDFSENFAYRPRNTATPNFGCAYQSNVAAMVANPKDFVEQRAMEPADATRRATVLDKYRKGENTNTDQRSQEEQAKGSEVAQ